MRHFRVSSQPPFVLVLYLIAGLHLLTTARASHRTTQSAPSLILDNAKLLAIKHDRWNHHPRRRKKKGDNNTDRKQFLKPLDVMLSHVQRGGGGGRRSSITPPPTKGTKEQSLSSSSLPSPSKHKNIKTISIISSITILSASLYYYRDNKTQINSILSSIFNRRRFKEWLAVTLNDVEKRGTRGLVEYTIIFAFWELLGLSTIPVETAAGCCFGVRRGVMVNFTGKLIGAMSAFFLSRILFSDLVKTKLLSSNNDGIFPLVEQSVVRHPLRSAILMRLSCFPELVKNCSMGVMPVHPLLFAISLLAHGLPYTILWTLLGHDAGVRLQQHRGDDVDATIGTEMTTAAVGGNRLLHGVVFVVGVWGIVGSPAVVALWVRNMKQEMDHDGGCKK